MKAFDEINLDEEPCIFPDCGHFVTVSSMDGQMNMASFYELGKDGAPVKIRGVSEPFSRDFEGTKVFPTCRGSLRSIARYGRIVRRGMLDEATKRFISWSSNACFDLAKDLALAQDALQAPFQNIRSSSAIQQHQPVRSAVTRL